MTGFFRPHAGTFLFLGLALLLATGLYQRVANPSLEYRLGAPASNAQAAEHEHPPLTPEDAQALSRAMAKLQRNPSDLDLTLHIAAIFSRNKDWINAVAFLDKALHLAPSDMRPRYFLGVALAGKGEYAQSATAFEQALAIEPDNVHSMFNLGILYRHYLRKPGEAAELFRKVTASPNADNELRKKAEEELKNGK